MTRELIEKAEAVCDAAESMPSACHVYQVDGFKIDQLRAALTAAKAELAGTEDRVREAAKAALHAIHCTPGDGPMAEWRIIPVANALRPFVLPAPALPAGTVVARLEWLRLMLTVAKQRDCTEIVDEIEGFLAKLPRPEPPKELVAEWERMATKYVRDLMLGGPDAAFLEHSPHVMRAYVAALRAAWEAEKWGA